MVCRDGQVHYSVGFLLLIITTSVLLAEIMCSVCFSKSQKILRISFSRTDSGLWVYQLVVESNFNFLHNSYWITSLAQSNLVLNCFSSFLWLLWWTLWLSRISLYFFSLFSSFAGAYRQSTAWPHFPASFCSRWGWADQSTVDLLFLLFPLRHPSCSSGFISE